MFKRFRRVARPASGQAERVINQSSAHDILDSLDDEQVMELASNVYWTLFEQFIALDGQKTTVSSEARVN